MPSTTITYSASEASRMGAAFGRHWNLKDANGSARSATEAEIRAWLIRSLVGMVLKQERAAAEAAITIAPIAPT